MMNKNLQLKSLKQVLGEAVENIETAYNHAGEITGIRTGINSLDHEISGLNEADLVIVSGRPSMGMTSLVLQIAKYAALTQNSNIILLSQDKNTAQIAIKMISNDSGVPQKALWTGDLADENWPEIVHALERLRDLPIYMDYLPALTIKQLSQIVMNHHFHSKLDLIILDNIHLMMSEKEQRAVDDIELGSVVEQLKQLAIVIKTPIIITVPPTPNLEYRENKRPRISDLPGAGKMEPYADLIIFLYRDEVYDRSSEDKGDAEIIIAKNRQGQIVTLRAHFNVDCSRFENFDC